MARTYLCIAFLALVTGHAAGQDVAQRPDAIVPMPSYHGDLWHRAFLSGDWNDTRTNLADKGLQFDVQWTQVVQSIVDGGRDTTTRYGSSLDYNMILDLQRMDVMPGAMIKFRAESHFGASVNGASGALLPVNTDGYFPLNSPSDDDVDFAITSLAYIQYLSPTFGVVLGKVDTLDGDPNEFASGRGTSQFLNANLVFNSVSALTVPYSTLAAGVIWIPSPNVVMTSNIMNLTDSSTSSGFDEFGEGWLWSSEVQWQYRLGDLPGGMNVGFLYAADSDFINFNRFTFQPGEGITVGTEDDTWALYWSGWQYLAVEDPSDQPIVLTNGEPDHQGVGLFARLGLADDDTNPVDWSASVGVGGKGIIGSRDHDTFGVGYFISGFEDARLFGLLGVDEHAQGLEAFYNIALTPSAQLTLDMQIVDTPLPAVDTTWIVGMRLNLRF